MNGNPKDASRHRRILTTLRHRYDTPVMNNVHRGDYVECLIASALGDDWRLTWMDAWDWAPWDCQHTSKARLEVKQAAARQTWDGDKRAPPRFPRFNIAPPTGYFSRDGGQWVDIDKACPSLRGRPADLFVFAWHGESCPGYTDHRDPDQWRFFVAAERILPKDRKSIGLTWLKDKRISPCSTPDLKCAVENACPEPGALKADDCAAAGCCVCRKHMP